MAKKAYYSTVPHVPQKKIADRNPVGAVTLGPDLPKMVPHTPGSIKSFGDKPKPHHYGHGVRQHKGALRISGHAGAHQVGYREPHVHKPPEAGHPVKGHTLGVPKPPAPLKRPGPKHPLPKLPKL